MENKSNDPQIVKLLSHPFTAAIDVQSKMIDKYLETVKRLAFGDKNNDTKERRETEMLRFKVNRLIKEKEGDGVISKQQDIEVPLISLVKIPALTMKEVKVNLVLAVNPNDPEMGDVKLSSEERRSSDVTPKYTIDMIADREEEAPGMGKLVEIMTSAISLG